MAVHFIRNHKDILLQICCGLVMGAIIGFACRRVYELGRREAYLQGYLKGSQPSCDIFFDDSKTE